MLGDEAPPLHKLPQIDEFKGVILTGGTNGVELAMQWVTENEDAWYELPMSIQEATKMLGYLHKALSTINQRRGAR